MIFIWVNFRSHGVDDALEFQLNWNSAQLQTEDLVRNATAKMAKTKPEFNDVWNCLAEILCRFE